MSFWAGFAGSVADSINQREKDERARVDAANERDSKIALHLLEAPDPDVQMAGLTMLQRAAMPAKRKKGLAGIMGGFEEPSDTLRPFLDLANSHARPGQLQAPPAEGGEINQPPGPGGAALPPKSPVEPGSAPIAQPTQQQPIGSPMALARGDVAPAMGEQLPASPMQQALQGGGGAAGPGQGPAQPAAAPPQLNVAVTAQRLSQDRGQLAPGQAAALFWPTAATLAASRITSELGAKAAFLQKLGASPEDVQQTMMASMGHPQAATSATRAGTVKLPSGEIVETYIQRDPASNTVGRMYWNGSAMAPLPAGSIEQKLGGAGAGPAITTHMTGAEAIARGYAEPGEFQPNDYVKVSQKGDNVIAEIDTRPVPPFGTQAAPTGPYVQGRGGAAEPNPNYIAPHPQVTAAKALDAALKADIQVKAGVPAQNMFARYAQGYPALRGLTLAQVQQLAQLPDNALDADVQRILGPVAIAPPPGGKTAAPAPTKPQGQGANALPPNWADVLAQEILRGRKPQ